MVVGWAAKLVNVYPKTTVYLGGLGRDGLVDFIHPPIDGSLSRGLKKKIKGDEAILAKIHVFRTIDAIQDYDRHYLTIIDGCRLAATKMGCRLVEVDILWKANGQEGVSVSFATI